MAKSDNPVVASDDPFANTQADPFADTFAVNDDDDILDLSGIDPDKGIELLSKGEYPGSITGVDVEWTENNNRMIKIKGKTPSPTTEGEVVPMRINVVLANDIGKAQFLRIMMAVAPDVLEARNRKLDYDALDDDLKGRPCRWVVKPKKLKTNRWINEVTNILAPTQDDAFLGS